MRFRLTPRSMTLNCYNFEFSRNFASFRRFGRQQQLMTEGRPVFVAH